MKAVTIICLLLIGMCYACTDFQYVGDLMAGRTMVAGIAEVTVPVQGTFSITITVVDGWSISSMDAYIGNDAENGWGNLCFISSSTNR